MKVGIVIVIVLSVMSCWMIHGAHGSAEEPSSRVAIEKQVLEILRKQQVEAGVPQDDQGMDSEALQVIIKQQRALLAQEEAVSSEKEEENYSLALLIILFVLILCVLTAYKIQNSKFQYIHETGTSILIGLLFGLVINLTSESTLKQVSRLNQETFFLLLLPPIIFESGYNMKRRNFFRNFGSILVFAVFGTIVSTVIIGYAIYGFGQWGWCFALTPVESASFGALISAVDPVTMLAIFHRMDADVTLYALVFGESVLNDAVAIVLFRTLSSFPADMEFGGEAVMTAIGQFIGIFVGSFATGIFVGCVSALFFKHVSIERFHVMETGLLFLFAYFPYLVAEAAGLSGIVSLLFAGITMSHYTYYNLQPATQEFSRHAFRVLAYLAETMVFGYIGLAVFSFQHSYHAGLIVLSIVMCLVSRVFNIFPFAALVNRFRKKVKISWQNQVIMWWAGLRGAIAFILSLSMQSKNSPAVVTTTLSVVIFTVFTLGGGTSKLLDVLKIKTAEESMHQYADLDGEGKQSSGLGDGSPDRERLAARSGSQYSGLVGKFKGFDKRVLKPFFTIPQSVVRLNDTFEDFGAEDKYKEDEGSDDGSVPGIVEDEHDDGEGVDKWSDRQEDKPESFEMQELHVESSEDVVDLQVPSEKKSTSGSNKKEVKLANVALDVEE